MNRRSILWGLLLALACKGDLKTGPSSDPAAITLLQGDQQVAEVGSALPLLPSVLVITESGSPAQGAVVVFSVSQGGGTATGTSVTTGSDGIATVGSWTLGTASGSNALTATVTGLTGGGITFSATARPGTTVQVEILTPPPASVGSGVPFLPQPAIQRQDVYGNPDEVAGASVTVSLQGSGGSLAGTTTVLTDATGTAHFSDLRLEGAVGDYTLMFSAPPLPTVATPLHVNPGSAAGLAKQAGDNQVALAGSPVPINPSVLVHDASGNPVAGVQVTFAVGLGGGSIAGGTATTSVLGIASSGSWTLGVAAGSNTVTATVVRLPPATFLATATSVPPGPPASITTVSGDNQTAVAGTSVAESLVVVVRDANGVALPGITVSWTALAGGGSISPSPVVTDAAGLAAAEWTLGTIAGSNTARASAAGFTATFAGSGIAGAAATLTRSSGNNQSATPGTPVAINPAVLVQDANGNPVAGVNIGFSVTAGGGTIQNSSGLTNAQGLADGGSWTLGPAAGPNSLSAASAGLTGSPAMFTATGTVIPPGPPASIVKVSGDGQTAIAGEVAPESLVVQVQDGNGAGVPGITVTWTVLAGGGSVSGGSVITGGGGLAAVEWTLGTIAGSNSARASAAGFTAHFSASGVAGPAAVLSKHAGDNQTAPVNSALPVDPAVRVTDVLGNPVAAVPVSFSVASGGGSIAIAQVSSDVQGIASSGSWTLGPAAGLNSLTATSAGLTGSPTSFSATGTVIPPGPPASIVKVSGDGQTAIAGEVAAESLVVQVRDANGVGVPGTAVSWTVLTGGGSVSAVSVITGAGGLAAVEWTLGTIGGPNTARAMAAGFTATFSASGIAGPAVTLTRNSGDNQTAPAGSPVAVNPTVKVQDANGNPVAGVNVDFSVTAGGGTIQNMSGLTDAQGLASGGTWTLGPTAGANTLAATSPGLVGSPAVFAATGTPTTGPPASVAKISGDNQAGPVGIALPESLVVKVADAGGTGIPDVAVGWAVLSGGGSLSSATGVTDLAGLAAVQWTLGPLAAGNTVQVSAAGFSQTFTASGLAGSASHLAISVQPGGGPSGMILLQQPLIQLLDANGNQAAQSGVAVTAAIAAGGGTLGGNLTILTDGNGQASFTDLAVLGLIGSRSLAFSAPGLTGVTSDPFSITAGPAATLIKQAGDNQSALTGTPVAVNPIAVVRDASGNLVPGVTVDFAISSGGGTIANASVVTNSAGRAFAGAWTLGSVAGPNTLTASSTGLAGSPAVYTATGTSLPPGPAAAILKIDGDAQTAVAGTEAAESLLVQVVDVNNAGVPGVTVSWTVLSGGGSVAIGSGTSDANGLAAAAWTLGNTAGPNTVRASAAGFNTTFSATGVAGAAATLSKLAGDNQSAPVGTSVPIDPTVRVSDTNGNPVAGSMVSFTIIGGNGSIGQAAAFTDGQGVASGGSWTLGPIAGANTLQAFSNGLAGSPLNFSATATAGSNQKIPLSDMGSATYFGHTGGLYPSGNSLPPAHASAGAARARNIQPRGFNGNPNPDGKFVFLSIGVSNTSMEWCIFLFNTPCNSWSLVGQATSDPTVNHAEMIFANGAMGGQDAVTWDSPTDPNYDLVRDNLLTPQGLSEKQVEVIWLKVVNKDPVNSLPSPQADAIRLIGQYASILRALKVRYPNLEMVFFSSRIYAGYSTIALNPEPFAYETGFAVKWVIEAQIDQMANGGTVVDPRAGNLNFNTVAPWIGWGPYLWADGLDPRSDGLTWAITDYESDLTHPNVTGQTKVAGMLLNFFKTDVRVACWFLAGQTCP